MKPNFSPRRRAVIVAAFALLFCGACGRTFPMKETDDVHKYVDYAPAAKRLPGMEPMQVQHDIGSPTEIERPDANHVRWIYKYRFCEADARCIYVKVIVSFENGKLVSVEPE